ncbi:MAG: HAMP domain-containing histidine kinase, partial [Elusimicrobia bacterium]|nr:HAMP domain-containing histidine kinase [Elusimicrobiota bacterium]
PRRVWLHGLCVVAGFASIAGLQQWSGGADSSLWTLYLLPVFTAAILLQGRELAWTATGACLTNAAVHLLGTWDASAPFALALETGILASAAAATWTLARAERESSLRAAQRRGEVETLEREVARRREQDRGLTAIAAGGAGAAHDLTTPLMVIRAYARMHADRGVEDPILAKDLTRIEAAAVFCQELVAGLLSRAAGPATERSLRDAASSALTMAEPILKLRRIALERDLSDSPMPVMAAPSDLERVIMNLLGNAAQVLPAGGRVTLRVRLSPQDAGRAEVVVEDDGPGIPADVLPRLFQPFATSRPGAGGTGLGLFVSRAAARRLGGDLLAENSPGGGARFTLRLPLARTPAVSERTAAV